jgi:hypothetical protein
VDLVAAFNYADVLRTAADGCEMLSSDIAAVVRKMAKP